MRGAGPASEPDALSLAYRAALDPREPHARAVLADLAEVCHVGSTSHVPGDPHGSAFREGKRAVFLYLAGRLGLPLIAP